MFDSYLNKVFANPGEDWEEKRLGEVCYNVQYGTSKKASKMGETPVIRMGNVQDGEIILNDLVFTDDQEDIGKYLLQKDDVLFNRTNSAELVGKSAIYKGERPAIFAGYLIRINRKTDLIDGDYLNYYLNSSKTREYGFSVMTSSVNQANINGIKLKEYLIPVPSSIDKQLFIVKHLDKLKERIKSLESIYQQKQNDLEELKKSILQKAFGGELTMDNYQLEYRDKLSPGKSSI
ncbi:MAG: restriction endonuclease subunit S [Candidatus Scalindua sp.]